MTEKIGKVSSKSVEKATGRDWDEWLAILDRAGAISWKHGEITAFLKKRYKLRPWWQQGVAIGFELARGKREPGRNSKGELNLTVTKSLQQSGSAAWRFMLSKQGLALWLRPLFEVALKPKTIFETEDGFFGEVRTLHGTGRVRRARLSWSDPEWTAPTYVQLTLVERPPGKDKQGRSILVFDHHKIKDARLEARMRKRWREAADAIGARLT